MHYLRILCCNGHFLWCSTLLKIISAFLTAASVRLITVQAFQAIPFYISNEGLPRINHKGLLMKSSFLLPICLLYVCVSEEESSITTGVIQDLISRTTSLIFPNQGFSEEQTKIDLIFSILVMAKIQSPGVDGFTNDQQTRLSQPRMITP